MKKLRKKNNKGFSLVELIVVVLIIGILAVSLAPQVMKWVGTARENSEEKNQNSLKSTMQLAVTDFLSNGGTIATGGYTLVITGDTPTVTLNDVVISASPATGTFEASVVEIFGGEYLKPVDQKYDTYTIKVAEKTGAVSITASKSGS